MKNLQARNLDHYLFLINRSKKTTKNNWKNPGTKQNQIDYKLIRIMQQIELIRKTAANANKKLNGDLEDVSTRLKQLNDRKIKKSENES